MCVLFSISCDLKIDYASLARRARSDFVVTTRTGDWDLYFEALGKGAFDVIQSPCYSTHVEMTITRVLREEEARLEYRSSR
jgi:DNA-binding NtrC family response regulator